MTKDKNLLRNSIDSLYARGGTAIYTGIDEAIQMLVPVKDKNYQNTIIVITDGSDEPQTTYENQYSSLVNTAIDNNITIYTIGIGITDTSILTEVSQNTGGKFYYAKDASNLGDNLEDIKEQYNIDSNNDGISDYYTKKLISGELRYGSGAKVYVFTTQDGDNKRPATYGEVQGNNDFDGDGLKNGDEVSVLVEKPYNRPYLWVKSFPDSEDSDGDGILDIDDKWSDRIWSESNPSDLRYKALNPMKKIP